ncbi:MAG: hypothetical protein Q8R25_02390 [bacterium]|nr:hypothetical protein [bacterium]
MSDIVLGVGLAHKLETACSRNDVTLADVDKMCEGDTLAQFRQVLLGNAVIIDRHQHDQIKALAEAMVPQPKPEHLVDLDADPFIPNGWKVEEHQKGGQFKWDAAKIALYLSEPQKRGRGIEGNKLRNALKGQPVFNANLLDYLLKNPHLIPEEWKDKYIFFWGTIYRGSGGYLYVRYLYWYGGRWYWSNRWLDDDWDGLNPAALRAS